MIDLEERLRSGDAAAYEFLFNEYGRLVYRTAYLITGDREEARDIQQEVFIAVWQCRSTFDPRKGKLSTWLHRITVISALKGVKRNGSPFYRWRIKKIKTDARTALRKCLRM
jgi:RNA polymerase sigma-70 factor (ECF subfamily)